MYQRIIIVGNLGRDPEMRFTPQGNPVTNLSVAVNRTWNDAEGQKHDDTTWFRVVVWGKQAEVCNQYLSKGRQVLVEGEMRSSKWEDQSGQTRTSWELHARNVRFLGGRGESTAPYSEEEPPETEDEIPF